MIHARCKIPNIARKIFFPYNLLLIRIKIGKNFFPLIYNLYLTAICNHRAAPITQDPIADSPDEMTTIVLSSAERKYGFHFLFILVFWRLFRNKFPRYTVRYDFQRKINIKKFPNGSIVFRNAATIKFLTNSWYYEPAKWLYIRAHVKIPYFDNSKFNTVRPKMTEDFSIGRSLIYRYMK